MTDIALPELVTDREKTACFTGHRPEKFPFNTDIALFEKMFRAVLFLHISDAAAAGYDTFISGMQRGMDIWAAQEVLRYKAKDPAIKLFCVSPFYNERFHRDEADRHEYEEIAASCDRFIALRQDYSVECYSVRNRFMADRSSLVIAAASDRQSGTWQTLNYARRQGLKVDLIDLKSFATDYGLDRY